MEELRELVIEFFNHDKQYHKIKELTKKLNIKGEIKYKIFDKALKSLVEDGYIFEDKEKGYRIFSNDIGMAYAKLQINKSGNGFAHTRDGYDIFIEKENLNGALDGDSVIIDSIDYTNNYSKLCGKVYKILKRNSGNVIFEVVGNGKEATLIPYNKYINLDIYIKKEKLKKLIDGDLVLVNISTDCFENKYDATIEKIIGHKTDPNIDVKLLANKYNIPIEFSEEAMEEAQNIPTEVTEDDIIGRVDLRDKEIVTIDCDDTKDRDDSVYVEKLENGNYKLFVNISAVNYYIKRETKLFEEALIRNTSHYQNNSCIPMFPHIISNGICSLNPNVDRLTKTIVTEINGNGEIVNINIFKSVIKSRKAMMYSKVNDTLSGASVEGYDEYYENLKLMEELSDIFDTQRIKRKCLDFNIPDTKIIQDDYHKTIDIKPHYQGKAERIIENFMVMTNVAFATYYSWLPIIYRIHEYPDETLVKSTLDELRASGFEFPKINKIDEYTINAILNKTLSYEQSEIIREKILMSMKKARYDTVNLGHFALQFYQYCHITSPIRRISDFITNTVVDEMDNKDISAEKVNYIQGELQQISDNASLAEKIDDEMTREANEMCMAEYMENHLGEEFEVFVTKVFPHGLLVRTSNYIIGKIRLEDLTDDKYYYDPNKQAIIGRNTKTKYQLGSKIHVISKEASKANRSIFFEINKQKVLKITK